jgi:hypothetical protein
MRIQISKYFIKLRTPFICSYLRDKRGGLVARVGGRKEKHEGVFWENLRGRDHFEDLGIDGRIILEGILNISVGIAWT